MISALKLATATTPSKIRANLKTFLKEVTNKNPEVHIMLSSGKNAALISKEELNNLKQTLTKRIA